VTRNSLLPTRRENVYIDAYDGKWWVHRRDPRERFGPFDTHPEAVRELRRLERSVAGRKVVIDFGPWRLIVR
jgi:hypothetical protein